ncbi:MAG: XTP/dITP diphosphatase [Lachnospiraceae bacterium]|nr:XTP/dITP diphosphatase [Lachnospiraceae bacterium]
MNKQIIFATKNEGKLKEIRELFSDTDYEIISLNDIELKSEIIENGTTFEENAMIKANTIMEETNTMVLADDSGLEVDFLGKEPGVYSARYLGENTPQNEKNKHIVELLEGVEYSLRTARFVCSIACAIPGRETFTVRGTIEGMISNEIVGENGFGYDPIFMVPKYNKTMAQLNMEEKNEISHRGQALRLMKQQLKNEGIL